ncbi:MAG: DUF4268 domain-containing protein [Flavobacteriales bacterium]
MNSLIEWFSHFIEFHKNLVSLQKVTNTMFSKEESKSLRKEFWTTFGVYMKKYNKVYHNKVRWVNYNTKCKDIYLRLDVDKKKALFSIDIQHKDEGMRGIFFEQFQELRAVITESFPQELIWEPDYFNEFGELSRIYVELPNVSVFNKNTWQETFQFMEKNIVAGHDFWEDFGEIFLNLAE